MTDTTYDDGLLRAKPPRPALQIGKEKVLVAIFIFGLLITAGIILGKRQNTVKPIAQSASQAGQPGYNVTNLPLNYEEMPIPTPYPNYAQKAFDEPLRDSRLDELFADLLKKRIEKHQAARKAGVTFKNLTVPNDDSTAIPFGKTENTGTQTQESGDVNGQDDKATFLNTKRASDTLLLNPLLKKRSDYSLMAGTLIPGLLLTGLNSDLPGQILGQVSQNIFDTVSGAYLLVPQGTKVIGEYDSRIVYGQRRVLIVWTRLIFPNGASISLEGMPGVDLSGYAGLSDQVNNHWGRLLTGVVFSSLLSASAQISQGRNYSSIDPTYGELAAQGVSRNSNEVGQEITRRNLNVQPTLEIRPGYRFNVFVNKDIILKPYSS